MCCDDFDLGDLIGLGLAIGEEIGEEKAEKLRMERELEEGDGVDDEDII